VDVHVLDRDFLLALAAVAIERFEQRGVGAGELARLIEILLPALERLLARSLDQDAPVSRPVQQMGRIVSHALVGGLHHQYIRI
jgi:hypothetical protein